MAAVTLMLHLGPGEDGASPHGGQAPGGEEHRWASLIQKVAERAINAKNTF